MAVQIRKAPKMTIEALQSKLEIEYEDPFENPLGQLLQKISDYRNIVMKKLNIGYAPLCPFVDDPKYPDIAGDGENLIGYHTLENGFTFLGLGATGLYGPTSPMFFIIYHDGKRKRAYVPFSGNMINHETGCFIGSTGAAHFPPSLNEKRLGKLARKYIAKGLLQPGTPDIPLGKEYILDGLYLMDHGVIPKADLAPFITSSEKAYENWYQSNFPDGHLHVDWNAMKKDILEHFEIIEPPVSKQDNPAVLERYFSVTICTSPAWCTSGILGEHLISFVKNLVKLDPKYAEQPYAASMAERLDKKDKHGRQITRHTELIKGHLTPASIRLLESRLKTALTV